MHAANHSPFVRIRRALVVGLALLPLLPAPGVCGQKNKPSAGRIVWWGKDDFWKNYYSDHTNGLIECGDEFVTNAVALVASTWQGLALKSDGTVMSIGHNVFGGGDIPPGLSNVVSVAVEGQNFWAVRRDGTVVGWGNDYRDQDGSKVVAGLSNVVSITWAGYRNYLALEKDGTVVGFRLDNPKPWHPLVKVHGEILSNVVALASMGYAPLVLKRDGTVLTLGYQKPGVPPVEPRYEVHSNVLYEYLGGESAHLPYQYTTADPVTINGQELSNAVAIASGPTHALALKKDGTVVGWGTDSYGAANVPAGLSNVIAIAATEHESLALKRDGMVVAWGVDYSHQLSVPAGLSNVVAIASAGDFNLAITTGSIPASVFIQPHGRLEEMEQKADLVFKGQVLSTTPITNAAFNLSWMAVNATKFKVISVLKGEATKEIVYEHYSGWRQGGAFDWIGPPPPVADKFEVGQSYLVFAERLDRADRYYSPTAGTTNFAGVFRQVTDIASGGAGDVIHTLGARPIAGYSVKEAHWVELDRLLHDSNPTNVLYAIDNLDRMSKNVGMYEEWHDFKRDRVLNALLALIRNKNQQVAIRAMSCFQVTSDAATVLKPYAGALIKVANKGQSPARRLAAIRALSGIDDEAVSNSLAQLLRDKDENVRSSAVQLLPRFPAEFTEPSLREGAKDASPKVRAAVAEAIGDGKMVGMLPTLEVLLADSQGDVHTSAGYALLKFDVDDVADILKANLNDKGFRPSYLCKLAEHDVEPWLTNLVEVLQERRERLWKEAQASGIKETTNYFNGLMALSGTYFQCWNIIYDYLDKLPSSAFQDGKLDWCLDVLEDAGNTGSREPVMLYKLYRTKGLDERAARFRQENGKCQGFDVTQYFDNVDRELKASAGRP
jgi:Regulator of chromosome condensation (RCC1) repeat